MADSSTLTERYDRAAGSWGDKMRSLGYADAYLGLLAEAAPRPGPEDRVCDVGCGSGSFSEGWVSMFGPSQHVTLLEPSAPMLDRAARALRRRAARPHCVRAGIEAFRPDRAPDHLLVAHVIEHCPDPADALATMRGWVAPGARLWLVASKPHWCNAIIWFQWRHRAFREAEIDALLKGSGWRLDRSYAFPSGPPSRTSRGYCARAV